MQLFALFKSWGKGGSYDVKRPKLLQETTGTKKFYSTKILLQVKQIANFPPTFNEERVNGNNNNGLKFDYVLNWAVT